MDSEQEVRLEGRVREHLRPGEEFRAVVWVSKENGSVPTRMTRAELSPFRFRRRTPAERLAADGPRRTLAERLGGHVRLVTEPRVLALTDRRVILLSRARGSWRDLLRPAAGPLGPLRPRWECARPSLKSVTGADGRLWLRFTDGSKILLLTPQTGIESFLAG